MSNNEYSWFNRIPTFISDRLNYIVDIINSFRTLITDTWKNTFRNKPVDEKEAFYLSYTKDEYEEDEYEEDEYNDGDTEMETDEIEQTYTFKTDIPSQCSVGKKRKLNQQDIDDPKCEKDYLDNVYTAKQLEKLYNTVAESTYLMKKTSERETDKYAKEKIFEYFNIICNNPQLALCTLLWFDSFHDFKQARIKEKEGKNKEKAKEKYNLNNIVQALSFLNQWEKKQNIDEVYRDSFFKFNYDSVINISNLKTKLKGAKKNKALIQAIYDSIKTRTRDMGIEQMTKEIKEYIKNLQNNIVHGFGDGIEHTVLKPCLEIIQNEEDQIKFANLLYNISDIFLTSFNEADFFHTYMIYNFNFNLKKQNGEFDIDSLLKDFQNIAWNQIQEEYIPYWCKDVDEESANFLRGTNVILPASIFDQNKGNSSKDGGDFVNIEKTIIPYANGHNFTYKYSRGNCNLTVSYGGNEIYEQTPSTSTCKEITNEDITEIEKLLTSLSKEIDITNFLEILGKKNVTGGSLNIANWNAGGIMEYIRKIGNITLFDDTTINLKGQSGFSPKLVTIQIIILLCKRFIAIEESRNYPLTCAHFDFWFSLKRIGDYGQILQAKQAGIPLFTNDKMQILLSIATCTSSVFSIDGTKAIWYDGKTDSFKCNKWAQNYIRTHNNNTECVIKRKSDSYKPILENLFQGINKYEGSIIRELSRASDNINKSTYDKNFKKIDISQMSGGNCR